MSDNSTETPEVISAAPGNDESPAEKPRARKKATAKRKATTKKSARKPKDESADKDLKVKEQADLPGLEPESKEERPEKPEPRGDNGSESSETENAEGDDRRGGRRRRRRNRGKNGRGESPEERAERIEKERKREAEILAASPEVEIEGMVEISPKGFGFIRMREKDFFQSPKDVFITPEVVRIHGLRDGLIMKCKSREGVRGPQLTEVISINGKEPESYHNLPYFEELTAINPNKRLKLETTKEKLTTRVIDLLAPIGRGQRGLIVAPPRTGKTTFLHDIAKGIQENYDEEEMHLMVVLIDERPEEVTDFKRSFPGVEVIASSNDSDVKNHTRMAQLAIERAKRLVEAGEHVFILMDSITRMARAFNNSVKGGGKRGTGTGGLAVGALEIPRRLFAAARNTREAGSLTIVATALIQTNSKLDEAIFQEFKGTGNMELVLDRMLAQNYVYPAVDIHRSGTRREELLIPQHQLEKIHIIRRGLAGYRELDAMEWMIRCLQRYPSNAQMLLEIKHTAAA